MSESSATSSEHVVHGMSGNLFEIALIARLVMDSRLLDGRSPPSLSTAAADVVAVINMSPMLAACDLVAMTNLTWVVVAAYRRRRDNSPWLTFDTEGAAALTIAHAAAALTVQQLAFVGSAECVMRCLGSEKLHSTEEGRATAPGRAVVDRSNSSSRFVLRGRAPVPLLGHRVSA